MNKTTKKKNTNSVKWTNFCCVRRVCVCAFVRLCFSFYFCWNCRAPIILIVVEINTVKFLLSPSRINMLWLDILTVVRQIAISKFQTVVIWHWKTHFSILKFQDWAQLGELGGQCARNWFLTYCDILFQFFWIPSISREWVWDIVFE